MRKRLFVLAVLILIFISTVHADEFPTQAYGPFFVGTKIYNGAGAPTPGFGLEGDYYLDSSNGDIYNMTAGVWVQRMNLFGSVAGTLKIVDDHILSNRSDINIWVQENRSSVLFEADQHILANRSEINIWVHDNRSAVLFDATNLMTSNLSTVSTWIEANKSAAVRLADDHIVTNLSTASTAAAVLTADIHILENRSVMNTWVQENKSATLSTTSQLILQNRSDINQWVQENRSAALSTTSQLILQNRSDINVWVQENASATLRLADDHIVTNVSSASTAAAVLTADQHIAINTSLVNTNLSAIVNGTVPFNNWVDIMTYTLTPPAIKPAAPATNTIRIYVNESSAKSLIKYVDDSGMDRFISDSVVVGYNAAGPDPIPAGRAVYATGSTTNVPTIDLAKADSINTMPAIGITIESIPLGSYGRICQVCVLENVNTNAFSEGDVIYVSATTAGLGTATPPIYPNYRQEIGTVLVKSTTVGVLQVVARTMENDGLILTTISSWMDLNRSQIIEGVHLNESALLRVADDHISTNSSSTATIAAALLQADVHILENRSVINTWILENKSANLLVADTHIKENRSAALLTTSQLILQNRSDINTWVQENKSANLLIADTHMTENRSVFSTWITQNLTLGGNTSFPASSTANDLLAFTDTSGHVIKDSGVLYTSIATVAQALAAVNPLMLQNRSDINTWVLENKSANLLVADTHIKENRSAALLETTTFIKENRSAALLTTSQLILQNRSDINQWVQENKSANLLVADTHMTENRSVFSTWITQNLTLGGNTSFPASSTANDLLAFTDTSGHVIKDSGVLYTSIATVAQALAAVNPLMLQNRSDINTWVLENKSANLLVADTHIKENRSADLLEATTFIKENRSAALSTTSQLIIQNRSDINTWVQENKSANLLIADTHIQENRSAAVLADFGYDNSNKTPIYNDMALNRSLMGNFSVMAGTMIAGITADHATIYAPNTSLGAGPVVYLGFPRGQYNASADIVMPSLWTGGAITPTFYWSANSGAGTIEWDFAARCTGDNGVISSYFGANTTVLDTLQTKDYTHIIKGSATTPSGSPAASAYCQLLFRRLSGAGTLTTEAKLLGVQIAYPTY